MKFKTKQEIKERNINSFRDSGSYLNTIENTINDCFNSFAERREFYEKYEGRPEFFTNHNQDNEWWKQNRDKFRKLNNTTHSASEYYEVVYALQKLIDDFNKWLFNYCFGDMIGG